MKICSKCDTEYELSMFGKVGAVCKYCRRAKDREHYLKNKEKIAAKNLKWYSNNREKMLEYKKSFYQENKDSHNLKARAWTKANPEKVKEYKRAWDKRNPHKVVAKVVRRKATKLKATPRWSVSFFIEEAYHLASLRSKLTGFKWHVDHIVPLNSKIVCGLHCEDNLAVIPFAENIRKSNKYWPDMPEEIINGS